MSNAMKSVNALQLRQCLGSVLDLLERDGAPVLVKRGQRAAAVLISLKDWQQRFADKAADEARKAIVERIQQMKFLKPEHETTPSAALGHEGNAAAGASPPLCLQSGD